MAKKRYMDPNQRRLFDTMTYDDLASYRPPDPPRLSDVKNIILDFETTGLKWWEKDRPVGVGYCLPDGTTGYLPYRHKGTQNLSEMAVIDWLTHEVRGKHIDNQSTKFDVHMAYADGVDFEKQGCTVSDITHAALLLDDNRKKFSLAELCKEYLEDEEKVVEAEGEKIDPARMAFYHPKTIAVRAEADCRQVWKLRQVMQPQLEEQNLLRVDALEGQVIYPVCEMERNSALIDVQLLKQWVKETEDEYLRLISTVSNEGGFKFSPSKTKDWIHLFQELDINLVHFTQPKGTPSFTDDALADYEKEWPIVSLARRAKKISSLRTKFLLSYLEHIGEGEFLRFHLQQLKYENYGTVSGRFSSWGKNIQQVMKVSKQKDTYGAMEWILRKLFIPAEGLWLSADADQIEYRLFAHYSNSERILQRYRDNPEVSYHLIVQEMLRAQRELNYQDSKNINFAKLYGAGPDKIAAMMGMSRRESQAFVDAYDLEFPEVDKINKQAMKYASQRGWVKTILGRRARFPKGWGIHKALNRVIQGSAADIMKRKIVELHKARHRTGLKMRFTVHDEVDGDIPNLEAARIVQEILNKQTIALRVPILWSVETGPNWAETTKLPEELAV